MVSFTHPSPRGVPVQAGQGVAVSGARCGLLLPLWSADRQWGGGGAGVGQTVPTKSVVPTYRVTTATSHILPLTNSQT